MDISFAHTTKSVYSEINCPFRRIYLSVESVVPDTNEDIGRVASVKSQVFLKGKEQSSRGITVTGEWHAVLLYITETENAVSCVRVQKEFQMDFDLDDEIGETLSQIELDVSHTETRVLNPRKVSVAAEIIGKLSAFRQEELEIKAEIPENIVPLLHTKLDSVEATPINAVCEKTFVLNEQFLFPEGKPAPSCLILAEPDFTIDEVQQVGSRVVVKGRVNLDVSYLAEDLNYPLRTCFSTPFSQILDTGAEECVSSTVHVELTSCYFDLIDTISGEKALDAELHAVLQMVSRCRQEILYVSDAYSNQYPSSCSFQNSLIRRFGEKKLMLLEREEELAIAEDCEDILSILPSLSMPTSDQDKISVQLALDMLYRSRDGRLSSVRRILNLEQQLSEKNCLLRDCRLAQLDLRPKASVLSCFVSIELEEQEFETEELRTVSVIHVQDDQPLELQRLPSVTLVRRGAESLWDLAKQYHSCVEMIRSANAEQGESRFLLVPRES